MFLVETAEKRVRAALACTRPNPCDNPHVLIGAHIRAIREAKKLSQGDVEKRSGLLRVYVSRVENGHTTPSLETLEKFARALGVPLYQLFYDGEEPPNLPNLPGRKTADEIALGRTGKETGLLERFRRLVGRMDESHRWLLLTVAQKMARRFGGQKRTS